MSEQFEKGELVWAKIRYSPAWPAKVVDPPQGARKKNFYYVYFYGTDNYGWVKNTDIRSYKEDYHVQREIKNSSYRKAVQEIAEIYHESQLENDSDFMEIQKPKRTPEEEAERQRKIHDRLKVKLFTTKKPAKKTVIKKKGKKEKKSPKTASDSSSFNSSCIITVHVNDYKQVIKKEAAVLLSRCDIG